MALPLCVYRTRSGLHKTGITDTVSVDVEAYSPPSEGGIDRVEFAISVNGSPHSTVTKTAPELRFPNYNLVPSPEPGAYGTGMVPTFMFGTTIDCGSLPAGDISVVATVFCVSGSSRSPNDGPIHIYSDWDGTDRRPNTSVLYAAATGSDATGTGSALNPVKTLGKLVTLIAAAGGGNVGGARGILKSGNHRWVGSSMGDHFTSGHWTLIIEAEDGVVLERASSGSTYWNGNAVGGSQTRVHFLGSGSATAARHEGLHLDVTTSNFKWVSRWEGWRAGSRFWSPGKLTIRYQEPSEAGNVFDMVGTGIAYRSYANCCRVEGVAKAFTGFTDVHDCTVTDFIELALGGGGYNGSTYAATGLTYSALNVTISHGRSLHPDVLGWVNCLFDSPGLVVASIPSPNTLRITATTQLYAVRSGSPTTDFPIDIAVNCAEIVGSSYWSMQVAAWPGNIGKFPVISVGYSAGQPYIDLDMGVLVPTAGPCPGGARLYTEYAVGGGYDPHGDVLHWSGSGATDSIVSNTRTIDVQGMQGFFWESNLSGDYLRCALVGNSISSSYPSFDLRNPLGPATNNKVDCVIWHNSWNCGADFEGPSTNCQVSDNVFRTVGGSSIPVNGVNGNVVTHNHTISGATFGISPSSGAWFLQDPGASPWLYRPTVNNLDTISSYAPVPVEYRWQNGTVDRRGAWANTGKDWSLPTTAPEPSHGSSTAVATASLNAVGQALSQGSSTAINTGFTFSYSGLAVSTGGSSATARGFIHNTVVLQTSASKGFSTAIAAAEGVLFGNTQPSAGNSSAYASPRLRIAGAATSAGTSSATVSPKLSHHGQAGSDGSSTGYAEPSILGVVIGSASSAGGSSVSAAAHLSMAASASSSGSSTATASSPSSIVGAAYSSGSSTATATALLFSSLKAAPATKKVLMKQRIHNALVAVVKAGPYYRCSVNSKTGQMTIDLDKPVSPAAIKVVETQATYSSVRRLKRFFGASERESWTWTVKVQFAGMEVAFEVFEESATDRGIEIPPVIGLQNQRRALARLVRADYSHPPEQSPNEGTFAEFTFEIVPELLRK